MQTLLGSVLFVALAGGCLGSAQVGYSAEVSAPEMVVISPGVSVIADYDEPIFYSDSYYWKSEGGYWYRSPSHTRGWVRVQTAPTAIRTIERPQAYVHYRATAKVANQRPAPVVRDHRAPPAERDHRENRVDDNAKSKRDHKDKKHDKHDD